MKAPPGFLVRLRVELYAAMQRLEGADLDEFKTLIDEIADCMRESSPPHVPEQTEAAALRARLAGELDGVRERLDQARARLEQLRAEVGL